MEHAQPVLTAGMNCCTQAYILLGFASHLGDSTQNSNHHIWKSHSRLHHASQLMGQTGNKLKKKQQIGLSSDFTHKLVHLQCASDHTLVPTGCIQTLHPKRLEVQVQGLRGGYRKQGRTQWSASPHPKFNNWFFRFHSNPCFTSLSLTSALNLSSMWRWLEKIAPIKFSKMETIKGNNVTYKE